MNVYSVTIIRENRIVILASKEIYKLITNSVRGDKYIIERLS